MMKKTKLLLPFFFINIAGLVSVYGQHANVSTGGEASGSGGTVSYSVGQVSYSNYSNTNISISEGVQQPYEIVTLTKSNNINISCSVFPNPTASSINLKIENSEIENLNYQLFNAEGKLLVNYKIFSQSTQIAMEGLPPAAYFLKINNNNKEIKSYKIIKN